MHDSLPISIQALDSGTARLAYQLVQSSLNGCLYGEHALAALSDAARAPSRESRALVVHSAGSEDLLGVAVFGEVAGTLGTGKLHFVGATPSAHLQGVASRLIDAAIADLAKNAARFVLAELPDDPLIADVRELLICNGFVEEARIPDFYADGIALVCLRREIDGDR